MILHLRTARFIVGISCFAATAIAQNQGEPMVTVTFHVVDEFGKTMHYKLKRFTRSNDGVSSLDRFEGLSSKRIPLFGGFEYRLQPNEPGVRANTLSGKFEADRADNLIVLRAKRNPWPNDDGGPFVILCGRLESPLPKALEASLAQTE